jgi:serine protease Do
MTYASDHNTHSGWRTTALSILAGGLLLSAAWLPAMSSPVTASEPPADADTAQSLQQAQSLSAAFRAASQKVMPAVVMIQTRAETTMTSMQSPGGNQEIPEELLNSPFFRRFFGESPDLQQAPQQRRQAGMGSGVIIDPAGIILTNNHVVAGGGEVTVKLHDGREFTATDVRTDPGTDIAVVRIEAGETLPFAVVGDSDHLQIGDWVLAVGSPFGLNETVTAGIISAKSRGIGITEREDFLQTDAAINPGNSGGPLVNLHGEIVGINTAISSTSGGYQGIGFAIPINMANWVGQELTNHGAVRRAVLGVAVQPLTASIADQLGVEQTRGALVNSVRPDSPAAKAGLTPGDVILQFDGQVVRDPRDLQRIVERADLEATHEIVVFRDGSEQTLSASVDHLHQSDTVVAKKAADGQSAGRSMGLQLSELDADIAGQMGLQPGSGVLITQVRPDGPGAAAGLEAGMVIERVGKHSVSSLSDVRAALEEQDLSNGILLLIRSGDTSRFVVLRSQD